jgi:hypothetical protein
MDIRNPAAKISDPPATVPVEHLGEYLHHRRLRVVRCYLNSRREFVVEVLPQRPDPIISTEVPTQEVHDDSLS